MTNWFQTDECLKFYGSLSFIEPFECSVERNGNTKGRIVGYIQKDGGRLKSFLSRRAIINGGPMLAEDITDSELETLLGKCRQLLKRKAIYAETRNFEDYRSFKGVFERCSWRYEPHYNYQFKIESGKDIISRFSQNHKRSVKTSLKNGAYIENAASDQDIADFYQVLSYLYRTKVKTPLFPLSFFSELNKVGKVIVVKSPENKVMGGIAMAVGEKCYEWFVCGDDEHFKKYHPSTLATYAGIQYATEHSCEEFDFMGAGSPGDGGYGVRDFKAKFGGALVEHGRFKCVLNRPLYLVGTLGVKILKKLK